MNEQNLIPFNQRTESEQRAIATEGGLASGEARRRKKNLREMAMLIGSLPIKNEKQIEEVSKFVDTGDEKITHDFAVVAVHYLQSEKGNVGSAKFIAQIRGELVDKKEVEIEELPPLNMEDWGDDD